MKRSIVAILAVAATVAVFAGCSSTQQVVSKENTLVISCDKQKSSEKDIVSILLVGDEFILRQNLLNDEEMKAINIVNKIGVGASNVRAFGNYALSCDRIQSVITLTPVKK